MDTPTRSVLPDGSDAAQLLERMMEMARISALEEMASGMAHELNQPLGAIAAFAQAGERMMARSPPMVEAAAEVFRSINEQAMHAGEGIHRIRSLFHHHRMERERCTPAALIDELMPVLQALAQRYSRPLTVRYAADLPALDVDRLRIQHVIFTLVQNALEASAASSTPRVDIEASGDRYRITIAVTDNAAGVPATARDQLFRPYFTTKSGGTGLGLASSRAIVEAHGGTISYAPLPEGGSRFWFELPIADTTK